MADSMIMDDLVARAAERIRLTENLPESTYRLQMHAGFQFTDALAIVSYLADLGVSHAYASPFLKARPGSTHGYDITDHRQLNPEIGDRSEFRKWVETLHASKMGLICDIVPNHMGVAGNENAWWNDVLENGSASPYASFFDISWEGSPRRELRGKLLLPVLGEPYGDVLERGELRVEFQRETGALVLRYSDHLFPISLASYALILRSSEDDSRGVEAARVTEIGNLNKLIGELEEIANQERSDPRREEVALEWKAKLARMVAETPSVRERIELAVSRINGRTGESSSFDELDHLLEGQHYRLSFWKVASDEINYRRFFDVNELAAISTERPEVFEATHQTILELVADGSILGLRIDHPDGLFDPKEYLRRLQEACVVARARALSNGLDTSWNRIEGPLRLRVSQAFQRSEFGLSGRTSYVVVEKILGPGEALRDDWAVYGTSGYEALNVIGALFIDMSQREGMTRLYQRLINDSMPFADLIFRSKRLILSMSLTSELQMLADQLDRIAQQNRRSRDFTLNVLREALSDVIACFPVYRSYISHEGYRPEDRTYVERATTLAAQRNPSMTRTVFHFIRDTLLDARRDAETTDQHEERQRFAGKFQQVTAPVTAKGVEDTAFYVYNRLISLNEVGGSPDRFGMDPGAVHRFLADRQKQWPYALTPLSTHDTKRSEDVRARLNVLSEMPEAWGERVVGWMAENAQHRVVVDDRTAPDANEEYLLYQTLVGAWPLELGDTPDVEFVDRIQAYMNKALHEAKVHSSWSNPDEPYDGGVKTFVSRVLDAKNQEFLADLGEFRRIVADLGLLNSLSQTLIRLAMPGVPDTYQGTELWDFSLVDPDNRRPVDYELRRQMLSELRDRIAALGDDRAELARELFEHRVDGRIKLYEVAQVLRLRRACPGLLSAGAYHPLATAGSRGDQVFGFARQHEGRAAIVVVPRLVGKITGGGRSGVLGDSVWGDTTVSLPEAGLLGRSRRFRDLFTGRAFEPTMQDDTLCYRVGDVFEHLPFALLTDEGPAS